MKQEEATDGNFTLPMIDLFLNESKREDLKQMEKILKDLMHANFPVEEIGKNFSREGWSYCMCPIRHFKNSTVECLDSYSNFVFAIDTLGELAVFLIDESDPENDEDTLVAQSHMLG